jgi:hypothetical protein
MATGVNDSLPRWGPRDCTINGIGSDRVSRPYTRLSYR